MPLFDLPLEQLKHYRPERDEPTDFDAFWQRTLEQARSHPLEARFEAVNSRLKTLEVFDLSFNGYGGQVIKGWLVLPRDRPERLPCVVEYLGYGGGRGFAIDWLLYASLGYAHLVMDTRGQGSWWKKGDTPDPEIDGGNPQFNGFMTRGVLQPQTYYYRRVFTDAVRAIEAARAHPAIDPSRVVVTGGSQGGGIALAAAALEPSVVAVLADVPFLCHFRRASEITDTQPYNEIIAFCKTQRDQVQTVFSTLSYFDGVNFAPRIRMKALLSVGLMDNVCPPSTVFAAYNHLAGEKEIRVYPYNNHEGGQEFQNLERVKFLKQLWPD